jgi:hypothetical protein
MPNSLDPDKDTGTSNMVAKNMTAINGVNSVSRIIRVTAGSPEG